MNYIGTMIAMCLICLVILMTVLCNVYTIKFLIVLCFFQNILLVLISPFISKIDFYLIILSKEVLVLFTIVWYCIRCLRLKKGQIYSFIGIFIMFVLLLVYGSKNAKASMTSFRQLIIPFEFFLFGQVFNLSKKDVNSIIVLYIKLCVFACLFGYVELVIGDRFWEYLGIQKYTMLKYGQIVKIKGVYCWGNMYTTDLVPIFGIIIKRMCSILVDPVILSQLLAVALIFVLFYKDLSFGQLRKKIYIFVLLSGLIMTYGKGGLLIFLGAVLYICYFKKTEYRKWIGLVGAFGVCCSFMLILYSPKGSSINSHVTGLTDYLNIIWEKPFGGGIGTEGNLAAHYGEMTSGSGESFVGTLIGQLGIIGIIIYVLFIGYILKKMRKKDIFNVIMSGLIIMVMITSLLNNTAISFTNCFIYFILAGIRMDCNDCKIECLNSK